jgi:hypothetical protein
MELTTVDSFWKKWHKEYLLSLREQHRGSLSVTKETSINIGDVVSVHDENRSRAKWRLARVDMVWYGKTLFNDAGPDSN